MECFIHDCKLEKCTSQSGWDYVKCPMSDCFIFMGLSKIHHYLKNVQDQTQAGYKWDKEKLKCFCSEPLVLCEWRSEHNPGRIYFKCPGNRCFLLVGMRGAQWYKHGMDEQHRVFRNTVRHAYPTTGYSWKNMLKDQIETYPRFTTTSITKKIVCPWGCNLYCIQRISMLNSINHTCSYINV